MPKRTSEKEIDINIIASKIIKEATKEPTKEITNEKNPAAVVTPWVE